MDPITDLPATTEAAAHIAYAANPTPTAGSNHNHPSYAEMITAAITALKEKDGSSRIAISKYIDKQYSNLPPSHSALLTHHLKRLKNSGQLVMLKHSYMLPRSTPVPNSGADLSNTTSNYDATPKRKPGRPPKPRPEFPGQPSLSVGGPEVQPYSVGATAPQVQGYALQFQGYAPQVEGYLPQVQGYSVAAAPEVQPFSVPGPQAQAYSGVGAEPMFVSLGLADEPVPPPPEPTMVVAKRGRGRPPKVGNGSVVTSSVGVTEVTNSAGQTELGKRGRGRPSKPKSMAVLMGNGGLKRGRGRPPRIGAVRVPLSGNAPRPIGRAGRPKTVASSGPKSMGRPRGRPPKNVAVNGGLGVPKDGVGGGLVPAKRSGRPLKTSLAKKPKKLTGRPAGRPKMNAAGTAVLVTDPQQLVAYQDLKTKLDYFQAKIKQAVDVVKPCLNTEFGNGALGALEELEALATMDVTGPLHVEGQEPQPLLQNYGH